MKRLVSHETVAICTFEIAKGETELRSLDEIVAYLRGCIEAEPLARFVGIFDHYAHTRSLPQGVVAEGIRAAKNLVFCFGITLPDPQALALRDFLLPMLAFDPARRATAAEMLQHPWLSQ